MRDSLIESPLTSTLSHYRDWDGLKTLHCDGVCASWLLGIRKGWLYFWWKLKRNNTLVRPYWVGSFHDVEGKRLLIQGCFEPPRNTHHIMYARRTRVSPGGKDRTQLNFIYPQKAIQFPQPTDHLYPTIRTTSVIVFGLVWIFGIFLFQALTSPSSLSTWNRVEGLEPWLVKIIVVILTQTRPGKNSFQCDFLICPGDCCYINILHLIQDSVHV